MPLVRRIPKRGFHSPFRIEYQVVNVETLEKLATDGKVPNGIVSPEVLAKLGVLKRATVPVKILGNGDLKAKLSSASSLDFTGLTRPGTGSRSAPRSPTPS